MTLVETIREEKLKCEDISLEVLRGHPEGRVCPSRKPALENQNKIDVKKQLLDATLENVD